MIYLVTQQQELLEREVPIASVEDVYNYFADHSEIAVDTETDGGGDPYTAELLTLQLGDANRQYVIDLATVSIQHFKELLESDRLFLLQNAKFDLRFFLHNGIKVPKVYDTFLAECILTTGYEEYERSLGLDDIALKYANAKLDKTVRGQIKYEGLSDRVIDYAAQDVKYLHTIKRAQMSLLKENQLANDDTQDLYSVLGLENRVVQVFAHMEYVGVKIDTEKWIKNTEAMEKQKERLQEELDKIVVDEPKLQSLVPQKRQGNLFGWDIRPVDINYGSPQQKIEILNLLGLDTDTSADRFLQSNQDYHPFIRKLREFNTFNKLVSSFGMEMLDKINPVSRRIHPDIWQILKTGRISVSDPNLNQIPRKGEFGPKIRSAFIPEKGFKIVGGDYSSFELCLIAEFSQDPLWLEEFNSDDPDLHTTLAMQTFDIDKSGVKDDFPPNPDISYRDVQKTINYGLAYGMTKYKLSDEMKVSISNADATIKSFFAKIPNVERTLEKFGKFGVQKGYVTTAPPYRRRRWFKKAEQARDTHDKWLLESIERKSKNTPIQGTNGDIIKLALVKTYELAQEVDYEVRIVLSIYDEIQTEVEADHAEEWRTLLQQQMEQAGELILKSVPCIAECEVNDYWKK